MTVGNWKTYKRNCENQIKLSLDHGQFEKPCSQKSITSLGI